MGGYLVRAGGNCGPGCDRSLRRDSTEQEALRQVCTPSLGSNHFVIAM